MERAAAHVVRGRANGVRVGTLIGCGWAALGLQPAGNVVRALFGIPAVLVVLALLWGARRLLASARALPPPANGQRAANRRVWILFWLNFAAEIVLLNVAVALLAGPSLRIYWIPAISFVVGLHFVPMGFFFRVPSYFACAAAMMVTALVVTGAILSGAPTPTVVVSAEALINATILWATAGWGLRTLAARHAPPGADE